jgi:organic hydroperoxide reductase OsmC/OhrA
VSATTTTTSPRPTVRTKEVLFPVSVEWIAGRSVLACVDGKPDVPIAPPPVFRGTDPTVWSPEDLFVSAAASCLAVTYTGLIERAGIRLASLRVDGEGTAGMRDDGRFGFTAVRLRLRAVVPPADLDNAAVLAAEAEEQCLVAASFALPVDVDVDLRTSGE